MTQTIAVINQKGGVGKTTTAINVAAGLARAKHKTLLIDLDAQGNTTSGLGVKLNSDSKAVDSFMQGTSTIEKAKVSIKPYFDLLPADNSLAVFEQQLANINQREFQLKTRLETDPHNYDFVIIDCPPALGLMNLNALAAANYVLVPVQAEYYALEGLGQLLALIKRVKDSINPDLKILGIVMTMYDRRTSLARDVNDQLKQHFGELVFKTTIPRNIRLAEAPSHGLTIYEYEKWSKGARSYNALTKEILKRFRSSDLLI